MDEEDFIVHPYVTLSSALAILIKRIISLSGDILCADLLILVTCYGSDTNIRFPFSYVCIFLSFKVTDNSEL